MYFTIMDILKINNYFEQDYLCLIIFEIEDFFFENFFKCHIAN